MENGTNQKKIFHFISFLNTATLEAKLINVPMVKENGTTEEGKIKFSSGINIRLAPPPQMALIQNAKIVANSNSAIFKIIFFLIYLTWIFKIAYNGQYMRCSGFYI